MPRHSRFRVTERYPLERPGVSVGMQRFALNDAGVLVREAGTLRDARVDESGEAYLALYEVDLDDPEAIIRFVDRYSVLGVLDTGFPASAVPLSDQWLVERADAERAARMYKQSAGYTVGTWEPVSAFRLGASIIRSLTDAWALLNRDDAAARAPVTAAAIKDDERVTAASLLQDWLSAGLAPFTPGLVVDVRGDRNQFTPLTSASFDSVPLYSHMCLELYKHIVDGLVWRRCADETCRKPFVRQLDRAEYGQHRTHGVKYHSAHCAHRQAQREYRRREKEKPK